MITELGNRNPDADVAEGGRVCPPEILAPAGGREQFFAALNSGADAVFLGLRRFNARARAENFGPEDLRELLPLARRYGMKVLVTLNVLIKETELEDLARTLAELEDLEVDAIIVQDAAVAALARHHFPGLRLHASTQLAIHNLAGTRVARDLGFKRIVLARELTAQELRAIRKGLSLEGGGAGGGGVELEAFCHGSLCYSYSGLCFFSGAQDSRSGNRGECAYTCRKPYRIVSEAGHGFLFSMRDLATADDLELLVGSGVHTLKIEGRKKDAQYVSTVVRLYRNKLDALFGRDTLRPEAPAAARGAASGDARDIARELGLTFQRESTSFFLKGRYHENVIDLDNPTHKGLRVGEVLAVTGGAVRVLLECQVERFDGLRIDPSAEIYHAKPQHGDAGTGTGMADLGRRYDGEVTQFSLRDMTDARGKRVPEAAAGERVEITVPSGGRAPCVGDVVWKTRSASLRARIEHLSKPLAGERLVPLRFVGVAVRVESGNGQQSHTLRLTCAITKQGTALFTETLEVPAVRPERPCALEEDLRDLLSLWGAAGIIASTFTIEEGEGSDDLRWFVPRSKLKEWKNRIGERIGPALDSLRNKKVFAALETLKPDAKSAGTALSAQSHERSRFSLKIDRLETLAHAGAFLAADPHACATLGIDEIVFEPKRMFLSSIDPAIVADSTLAAVRAFALASGDEVALRLAFPTVVRQWDEPLLKRWFEAFAARGVTRFEVGNPGALGFVESWGLSTRSAPANLASDFTLYALNTVAALEWSRLGVGRIALSIENDQAALRAQLARWPADAGRPEAILYKDTPLFIAESCSLTALHGGCPTSQVCGYRTLEVENEEGERFFVAHENCKSVVYGREAFGVTQQRAFFEALGVRDFRLDFLTRPYDATAVASVLSSTARCVSVPGTHPANFHRTLL